MEEESKTFNIWGSEVKPFTILATLLVALIALSIIAGLKVRRGDSSTPTQLTKEPFPEVVIEAESAYVYDIRNQEVLFAKNEDELLPLASLAKLMSALVALELSPEHTTISVGGEALSIEGDNGLFKDERWSLGNLLDFSLVTSSNDGMRAVALALGSLSKSDVSANEIIGDFVLEMNKKALELGLRNIYFLNETGLDLVKGSSEEVEAGAYGSSRDMSHLLEYTLREHYDLLGATRKTALPILSLDNKTHLATNTNIIAGKIPGLVASKTGFTNIAGGNLALVLDPELGRPISIVILGSTGTGRFEDAQILIDAIMEYIRQ